jgi:soluble lytic murein transglycosylase-like protein
MRLGFRAAACAFGVLGMVAVCRPARGAEHVTLKNGFELDCTRRIVVGDRVRLYFVPKGPSDAEGASDDGNYVEVAADAVVRVETIADPVVQAPAAKPKAAATTKRSLPAALTAAEMRELLAHAGTAHNIDADLLASVVRAESGGQVGAVSRAGAQGLMQLMPATANDLGVQDAFRADQNIAGGTAYLDLLLTKYHDNIALALAAYNAGPAAVDRYHGIPPYRETQAYVARVIREFNRRKQVALVARAQ